jgi:hypothetical protein
MMKVADGVEMKSYHTLVLADGTINTRTVDNLKAWSGWDGADPYWFMDQDLSGVDVEVVIANEPGFTDKTKMFPKIKWVNPPGGSNGGMPDAADRRAVLAKYGAKFRAVAGGTTVPTRAPAAPSPAPAPFPRPAVQQPDLPRPLHPVGPAAMPPTRPPAVAPPVRPKTAGGTQASAWSRLCALGAQLTQEQREAIWFEAVDATGTDQADMTPEGWSQVTAAINAKFAGTPQAAPTADEDDLPPF